MAIGPVGSGGTRAVGNWPQEPGTRWRRHREEAPAMDMKLEVIGIPVSNVDAAKTFYNEKVGFRLDHDITPGCGWFK
jgi:catechol-2,3-dioxygenase